MPHPPIDSCTEVKKTRGNYTAYSIGLLAAVLLIASSTSCVHAIPHSNKEHGVAELEPASETWGAPIEGASGYLKWKRTAHGFEGDLHVEGLKPEWEYTLCINGRKDWPGNSVLIEKGAELGVSFTETEGKYKGRKTTAGGSWNGEGFCDFMIIKTNKKGDHHHHFKLHGLPRGPYKVTFFLKDAHAWLIYEQTGTWNTIVFQVYEVEFEVKK